MSPTRLEQSLEFSRLCQEVLSLSNQIDCVTLASKNGRIIDSKPRDESVIKKLTKQEFEMVFMQRMLQTSMQKEFESQLGVLNYTVIDRDSMLEFIFPFFDGIIVVLTNPEISTARFAKKISKKIRNFEFGTEVEKLR